jgi:hypothetical protein
MIQNLIIGSGFSSVGCALGLIQKNKKVSIVLGQSKKKQNNNFIVKLPTRNFARYSNNINLGFFVNKIRFNKNYNFISYLGTGGLSNLWGQIINTKINFNNKIIDLLLKKLRLKENLILKFNKYLNLYEFKKSTINPLKIFNKYRKKIKLIKHVYVSQIKFDLKKKAFSIFLSNNRIITCKKLYICSGIFSSISLVSEIFNYNFKKRYLNINHSELIYAFSIIKFKNFVNFHNNKKEFFYFDKTQKIFCGRISMLDKDIINKYNLNIFLLFIYYFLSFFGFRILLASLMYKRKKNSTKITFKENYLQINAIKTKKNPKIIKLAKNLLFKHYKSNFYFFFKARTGSDFHYSCDILKNINFKAVNKNILKNLFIMDSSCIKNLVFFPAFYLIVNSFFRVIKNINIYKLKKYQN